MWARKKKRGRRIFHNVEYDKFEEDKLKELEDALEEHKEIDLWEHWTRVESLKMLYNANFNIKKALEVSRNFENRFIWISLKC